MFYYIWLIIPTLILSVYAQAKVKNIFGKYSKIQAEKGITGAVAARLILDENGLMDINVAITKGLLTDNYNPKKRTINLSESVYYGTSLAAIGIAAHETGHALQDKDEYGPVRLRTVLIPVKKVLNAAALTYIAAALSAVITLLRLVLIARNRR